MRPTPIRIRGKKRNRSLVSASQSQMSAPVKAARTSILQTAKKPRLRKQYVASMPTLQGLPQELLELIFLESLNLSLPRASPDLGRKLSSKAICMEFTRRCFFETVDLNKEYNMYVGYNHEDRSFWLPRPKRPADPLLQSQLLACRFFTWEFFLEYFRKSHGEVIKLFDSMKPASCQPRVDPLHDVFTKDEHPQLHLHEVCKAVFPIGLRLDPGLELPEKLLHGPWSPGKAELLYLLVILRCKVDWTGSTAGETAKQGLMEAIAEGNERAVIALTGVLYFADTMIPEALRYAVTECGCNWKVLRPLLWGEVWSRGRGMGMLDLHDPEIWQWADSEGAQNGKGSFLKEILKMAESRSGWFSGGATWSSTQPPEFGKPIPICF